MACNKCNQNASKNLIELRISGEWLTQDEVKNICTQCYDSMVKNNITKIKRVHLMEKLGMTVYEVIFKGDANSKFNFGGDVLESNVPKYYSINELPLELKELRKLPLIINKLNLDRKPNQLEVDTASAKLKNKKGLMWVGAAPKRVSTYGVFIKNQVNWDVSDEAIEVLGRESSYKVIE
jgi:hypothetical protein